MKIYQEWMLTSWLLLYFTKPQVFAHQNSWSTVLTRHDTKTVVSPKNLQHTVINRTNFTNEHTSGLEQIDTDLAHSKEPASIWPFLTNFSSSSSSKKDPEIKELMSASGDYRWPENFKNSPTFFYTHVEPHRFEYRAMFQHNQNGFKPDNFHPFADDFPPFPKVPFPPFPKFPAFPELFEPQPEVPPFRFPTVPPSIRRILQPTVVDRAVQIPRPVSHENLDGPLKKYDVVLGNLNTKYPKIFRFNEERMNIVDFEKQKKSKLKLGSGSPNSILGHEYVPREQFLILHGGIFTVQEPPLYNQNAIRKRKLARQRNFFKNPNE